MCKSFWTLQIVRPSREDSTALFFTSRTENWGYAETWQIWRWSPVLSWLSPVGGSCGLEDQPHNQSSFVFLKHRLVCALHFLGELEQLPRPFPGLLTELLCFSCLPSWGFPGWEVFSLIKQTSCLFVLSKVSFAVHKLLSLIRSYLFIFAFILFTLGDGAKKILLWFMSKRVLSMFSSRIFIVSGLTFRSLIHFEFMFVYGIRECSDFILLHVVVQFSQHHLLKRLNGIKYLQMIWLIRD